MAGQIAFTGLFKPLRLWAFAVIVPLTGAWVESAQAQSIANPSFEADTFTNFPGYVSTNTPITGWTANPPGRVGLNPSTNSPFANNGAIPDGVNVAFIQSVGGLSTLSNNIIGLLPGNSYLVSFRSNQRTNYATPSPSWSVNGSAFQPFTSSPGVGGANPYYTIRTTFVATAASAPLVIANQTVSDSTVLLDAFSVTALIVTNASDGAVGSLRRVLASVPTGLPQARITFGANLAGATLVLTNQLVVTNHYILDGSTLSSGVTIDGGPGAHRLFTFNAGTTNTLISLNLTGGNGSGGNGGAINNSGNLRLIGCAIFSNAANSSASALGGAVNNSGTLTVSNSTFSANSAFWGGAVFGGGTFVHCTIAGNSATGSPSAFGGGIYGAVVSENSIIAGNTGTAGADVYISGGSTSIGTNIIQLIDGVFGGPTPLNVNPLLTALANYGGLTRTRSLQTNSPARDGAGGSTTATDQRGYPRPSGAAADIGAVEIQSLFVVTNIADSGNGTLRSAILAVAQGSNDRSLFTFAPALSGQTITLASPLIIAGSVEIQATNLPGGLILSGNQSTRVMQTLGGSRLSLGRLTIANGYVSDVVSAQGAGLMVAAGSTVTVTSCVFSNNMAQGLNPALGPGGAVLGAAIYNEGVLTVSQCAFQNNSAKGGNGQGPKNPEEGNPGGSALGGAIFNNSVGELWADHNTFAGNTAVGGNGAPTAFGGGDGGTAVAVLENRGTANVIHNTFAGNSATGGLGGAGIFAGLPGASLGGVYQIAGSLSMSHSLLAGNNPNDFVWGLGGYTETNNLIGGAPLLAPLGDYGGPTPTMALLPGSPAIDGATGSTATNDQRGIARPYGAAPDIGAFEFDTAVVWTNTDSGAGSLRYALEYATNGASITFEPSMSGQTILLDNQLIMNRNVILDASALPDHPAISSPTNVALAVDSGATGFVHRITFRDSQTGILNSGALTLIECMIISNASSPLLVGGGAFNYGMMTLQRCTLAGNSSPAGGAIYNFTDSVLELDQCTLYGNSAGIVGGGLLIRGTATITHTTIAGNSSDGEAGGIAMESGILSITNSIVAGNVAGSASNNIAIYAGAFASTNSLMEGDPLLAPLGDYGGPTPTMALLPGSSARNSATGSGATSDQRGFPIVGIPDIGAYEAGTTSNFNAWVWETLLPTNANHAANADPDGDGVTNEDEWGALTDPGSGLSYLRALSIGGTNVTFPSVLNRTYRLQQAAAVTGPWSNSVAAPIAGDGTVKSFGVPVLGGTQLYFRIEAGP